MTTKNLEGERVLSWLPRIRIGENIELAEVSGQSLIDNGLFPTREYNLDGGKILELEYIGDNNYQPKIVEE